MSSVDYETLSDAFRILNKPPPFDKIKDDIYVHNL